jgi:hypothetical protein
MRYRFQFSILDGLLLMAIVGAVSASIATRQIGISFLTAAGLLLFVLHRPVLLRLWTIAVVGTGTGLLAAMVYKAIFYEHRVYETDFGMMGEELAGWGAGLLVGGITVCRLFIYHPPADDLPAPRNPHADINH